jgi:hypothetical protein
MEKKYTIHSGGGINKNAERKKQKRDARKTLEAKSKRGKNGK